MGDDAVSNVLNKSNLCHARDNANAARHTLTVLVKVLDSYNEKGIKADPEIIEIHLNAIVGHLDRIIGMKIHD